MHTRANTYINDINVREFIRGGGIETEDEEKECEGAVSRSLLPQSLRDKVSSSNPLIDED